MTRSRMEEGYMAGAMVLGCSMNVKKYSRNRRRVGKMSWKHNRKKRRKNEGLDRYSGGGTAKNRLS